LALGLCVLCGFQWFREAGLHDEIEDRNQQLRALNEEKNAAELLAKRFESEIDRLEADRVALQERVRTSSREASEAKAELAKLAFESESAFAQLDAFKEALENANASIQAQNEGIQKMNEEFKRLADDRNSAVEKYNELARQFDELGQRYNDTVDKYNTLARRGGR
jgi:chromosome segregation ATPase